MLPPTTQRFNLLTRHTGVASIAPLLSTTLFYLAHYPETFTRLAHELRTTFASESDIRLSTLLTSCPYLLACLDETFRMNPVLANAVFRDVSPTGAVVGDQAYPPGASLGVALWCLHRNEAHFSQPHKFVPERYLGSTEEERAYAKRAWFPFSTGPRTCVGKRLAYVVVGLAVARLVWRFDMRLAPDAPCCGGKPAEKKCTDRTYKSWIGLGVDGPVVQFMPRS